MNRMSACLLCVMVGLVPAIRLFADAPEDVDVRDKRGHDGGTFEEHRP
jgi:hypothetical protein